LIVDELPLVVIVVNASGTKRDVVNMRLVFKETPPIGKNVINENYYIPQTP
jgi:hypothetical protein